MFHLLVVAAFQLWTILIHLLSFQDHHGKFCISEYISAFQCFIHLTFCNTLSIQMSFLLTIFNILSSTAFFKLVNTQYFFLVEIKLFHAYQYDFFFILTFFLFLYLRCCIIHTHSFSVSTTRPSDIMIKLLGNCERGYFHKRR